MQSPTINWRKGFWVDKKITDVHCEYIVPFPKIKSNLKDKFCHR